MSDSQTTTSHNVIKNWVNERGGYPATVKATETKDEPGLLRIDFGEPDEALDRIEWEEFFQKFDDSDLAFLYQEETADGNMSRFCKFINKPK